MVNAQLVSALEEKAREVRVQTLRQIYTAQSGHPGGALSCADILTALYFNEMNIDPKNPDWEDRDRFILSKGHVCPVMYACLALRGFFEMEVLDTLRKQGSILQGHPDKKRGHGIDMSSGSLGQGLSIAAGIALAGKRDRKDYRVFAVVGDGECQEGQIWEAAQSACKYGLDNLIFFVDVNNLQVDGYCHEIMPNGDLEDKFRAFGCDTFRIDGHDMNQILSILELVRTRKNGKPKCIVCDTIKGKGVSYMEDVCVWHGKAPNEEQYRQALKELEVENG